MMRDLLWSLRSLRCKPLFTAVLTVVLALGIGANTAIFSVVDAVLLRPLPYQRPDRLVRIEETTARLPNIGETAAEYLQWRERRDLFAGAAAYLRDMVTITGDRRPDQVWLVRISPGMFHVARAPTQPL